MPFVGDTGIGGAREFFIDDLKTRAEGAFGFDREGSCQGVIETLLIDIATQLALPLKIQRQRRGDFFPTVSVGSGLLKIPLHIKIRRVRETQPDASVEGYAISRGDHGEIGHAEVEGSQAERAAHPLQLNQPGLVSNDLKDRKSVV